MKMCDSRKYPYPHHGGNWKFRRGEGVKDLGNSEGKGGLDDRFSFQRLVSRGVCGLMLHSHKGAKRMSVSFQRSFHSIRIQVWI